MLDVGLEFLASRRKVERLKLLHKIANNNRVLDRNSYIDFTTQSHTRNSHPLNIVPYQCHLNCFKFSFFPRTIENWNSIDGATRSLDFDKLSDAL